MPLPLASRYVSLLNFLLTLPIVGACPLSSPLGLISINMAEPIHIDGTTLEGGGQLLRFSLCLSSLTRIPTHITKIRANRGKPGVPGGLKQAHLVAAEWLAKASRASTQGMHLKSSDLDFRPATGGDGSRKSSVWDDVYENGKLVRRESSIKMTSPGSILLVLQAVLPYILFSPPVTSTSQNLIADPPVPIHLSITGGTNVWHSLSYEYAAQVLFPILSTKLGLPPINMTMHARGYSAGRTAEIGKVTFVIQPLSLGQKLPAFIMTDRGDVCKITVTILAGSDRQRVDTKTEVERQLQARFSDVELEFNAEEDTQDPRRWYLLLVAETANGFRLGRDWIYDQKIDTVHPHKTARKLVTRVVNDLAAELAHGGCVDEYLQDQLVIFQALANGRSIIDGREASLHTKTVQWLAERLLDVKFVDDKCEGIGFVAGRGEWTGPSSVGEIVSGVERLQLKKVD